MKRAPILFISALFVAVLASGVFVFLHLMRDEDPPEHYRESLRTSAPETTTKWESFPQELETNEVRFRALEVIYKSFREQEALGVSYKDRTQERIKINTSNTYAYVAYRVMYLAYDPTRANLTIMCQDDYFDPRTGDYQNLSSYFLDDTAFHARKTLTQSDVDRWNVAWGKNSEGPSESIYTRHDVRSVDFEYAQKLAVGDAIVCRVRLFIDENEAGRLIAIPVRRNPLVKPFVH